MPREIQTGNLVRTMELDNAVVWQYRRESERLERREEHLLGRETGQPAKG